MTSATLTSPALEKATARTRLARRWRRGGPAAVAAASFALYLCFSLSQWLRRVSPSWDLAIFTQLAKRYAHLQEPIVTVKGDGFNLLGDHFHPLLATLGVPYALFPSAVTLLVVQALLFAVSVWVITRQAERVVGARLGLAVGASYAVSFGLVGAVAVQFHEIALAVPLLALSLVALCRERWVASAVWAAPLVFVKEDLGLTVLVIGVLLVWRGARRVGLLTAAWGAVWFIVTTQVLIPALSSRGQWDYGDRLDLGHLATHPWDGLVWLVDDQRKVVTVVLLIAVTGLIGLRSPVFLVAVPTLAWRMWSSNYGYWGHTWHYSAVLMPIAFVALLDGVRLARSSRRGWMRRLAVLAPAVAVAVAVLLVPQSDLARMAEPGFWRESPREAQARAVLALIPDGASVETDTGLMNYVVDRGQVYYLGNDGNPPPDFLLVDAASGWSGSFGDVAEYAEARHPGTDYRVVFDARGYKLAERSG